MASPARVFLSYARKDGEQIADDIRQRLEREHPELELWQDLVKLLGGKGWLGQILEAIEKSRYLVMVMTPEAQRSPTVQKEWRHARQNGVQVIPVMDERGPRPDFGTMPRWMSKAHFYTLPLQWDLFVAHLQSPCQATRVPFMAPDLPEGFVERSEEFGKLIELLLDSNRRDPVAITTALHGAAGFGKTTLAAALCHHDEVINAFDDGILWVTLGEKPNVLEGLTLLYAAVTGERPTFVNERDAELSLARKLGDKNCLLVIDDVWKDVHLCPFLSGGKECARLVTTRQFEIAAQMRRIDVDEMTTAQATEMLARGFDVADREPFRQLARRLREWPLMLDLARGALRLRCARGESPTQALRWVNQTLTLKGFTAFDRRDQAQRNQAVSRSIGVSLDLLTSAERNRYFALAILPERSEVPLRIIGDLWGCPNLEAEELVERLHNLSLVRFDLQSARLRLHDAIRAYLATQLTDSAPLHARLVDRWRDWRHLEEVYAWRWLAYHLRLAGRLEELNGLLLDFSWMEAKLQATGVTSLIADYRYLEEEPTIRLVQATLRVAARIVARDPTQLAGQLLGRLLSVHWPGIEVLLRSICPSGTDPWLRPRQQSLTACAAPVRTLAGHAGTVCSVAVTPDGRRAVSASADRTLKVWDLESGDELDTLEGHRDVVWAVALTPDGRSAVSGSEDGAVKVWDLRSRMEVRTIDAHSERVVSVAVSCDGRHAISASEDGTLKVWDLASGMKLQTLDGHSSGVWSVALTPDGRLAVSASADWTLKLWDLQRGVEVKTLQGHTAGVRSVAITPDGRRIVSGSMDETVKVWDLERSLELITFESRRGWVRSVAVTPDGRLALSAFDDGTLTVWHVESGTELRTLEGHRGGARSVAVTPDGKRAISASLDRTLKVWDLESGAELRSPGGHRSTVRSLAVTPDGRHVVSGSFDGMLRVWDLERAEELRALVGHEGPVRSVAVGSDGRLAVSSSDDRTFRFWDIESGVALRTWRAYRGWGLSVALTPDQRRIVWASADGTVKLWDLSSGEELRSLEGHSERVVSVAITPDARRVVSASNDWTLKVWDLETGKELRTLEGHGDRVTSVAVTPDGRHAISASGDGTLKVWDLESGWEIRTLVGHRGCVWSVAVTRDGGRIVSGSEDRTVKVWNLAAGKAIATFTADAGFESCAVAQDGRMLVAADRTGRVHFLKLEEPVAPATG